MSHPPQDSLEDPFFWISRLANKLRSLWLVWTYPFESVGKDLSVHYSCELRRSVARLIKIGDSVTIGQDAWINIPEDSNASEAAIVLEDGCTVGRRCVISARNRIQIGRKTVFAPSVLVMDHNHAFEDVMLPISDQGSTKGGIIRIEEGCWLGFGAVILCGRGELVIGKNSVVGANSVVTRSVPPYSVVTGNPARLVKQFDPIKEVWVIGSSSLKGRP